MKVKCINCGKPTDRNTNLCEHCGYDINNFLVQNKLTNTYNVFICPVCGHSDAGQDVAYLKCMSCGHIYVSSNVDREEYWDMLFKAQDYYKFKREFVKSQMGDTINWEIYDKNEEDDKKIDAARLENQRKNQMAQQIQFQPKCPTCQSTNIKKISATSKATNAALFGLFGNKRKKQFHCNNCGYEW